MLHEIKRRLREHRSLGPPYFAAARTWSRFSIRARELMFGRYYTGPRFDKLFKNIRDPWGYETDPVAAQRRRLILERLPLPRYETLFEIGCAEGWMSPDFAMRANSMIAADISPVALARARERCASFPNVQFHAFDLLTDDLPDSFDAIICAGVLVFIPEEQQALIRDKIVSRLEPGGDLLLEHTRDAFPGEAAGGAVHQLYRMHSLLTEVDHVDADNYAITVFRKRSA